MNNSLGKNELSDVLECLKKIISDDYNAQDQVTKENQNDKFILDSSLRIIGENAEINEQEYQVPKSESSRLEELILDTESPTQKVGVAQGDCTDSLEPEVGDQGLWNSASGKSEKFSKYIDYEALRPIVAEIIRQELRSSLGESITSNIRAMVHREIEVAFSKNLKK